MDRFKDRHRCLIRPTDLLYDRESTALVLLAAGFRGQSCFLIQVFNFTVLLPDLLPNRLVYSENSYALFRLL
jgi:hypothetical protein